MSYLQQVIQERPNKFVLPKIGNMKCDVKNLKSQRAKKLADYFFGKNDNLSKDLYLYINSLKLYAS